MIETFTIINVFQICCHYNLCLRLRAVSASEFGGSPSDASVAECSSSIISTKDAVLLGNAGVLDKSKDNSGWRESRLKSVMIVSEAHGIDALFPTK